MLPSGWKRQPLANVAVVSTGVAKGKKGLIDPIELPYLRVANVQDGYIDLSEVKSIQIERSQLERYALQYGDVLMTEGGDFDKLGRGDIWKGQITPCLHQNHIFAVRPDQTKIIPYFLSTLAGSHYGKTYFFSCAKKSTNLASINSTQLKEFPVLIPPLFEQQKIAQILSTWDKAIEKLEALIAAKQKRKKALMQQLLTGNIRFPGFDGEWKEVALLHIANVTMGLSPKSDAYNEDGVGLPLIQGNADIKNRLSAPRIHTTEITKVCKPKDILMSVRAPVGAIAKSIHHACIGRGICAITARNGVDQLFLYYWLLAFESRWESLSQGSTFESVNSADIKSLAIYMPIEETEQQKIASVLATADKEIAVHQNQLTALKQQKTGLMQQLLTGKKRVNVNQAAA